MSSFMLVDQLFVHGTTSCAASWNSFERVCQEAAGLMDQGCSFPDAALTATRSLCNVVPTRNPHLAARAIWAPTLTAALSKDCTNCVGATALYLALATRLRVNACAARQPGHVWPRCFVGGSAIDFQLATRSCGLRTSGGLYEVLDTRGFLAIYVNATSVALASRRACGKALCGFQLAHAIAPADPMIVENLRLAKIAVLATKR